MNWRPYIQILVKRGVILVSALMLCSCGKPAKNSALPGEWVAHFPYGTEHLSLQTNTHYLHSFTPTGGDAIRSEGEWDYSESDGTLVLKNIMMVHGSSYEKLASKPTNIYWALNVFDYGKGRVQLTIDSDRAHFFERAPKK